MKNALTPAFLLLLAATVANADVALRLTPGGVAIRCDAP